MPTTVSHNPTKIPMIREKDIIVLGDILEGKLACRDARSRADGQTITARPICAARNLLRASRAARNPYLYLLDGVHAGKRRQGSPAARVPAPAYKVVVADVVKQLLQRAPTVLLRILDLPAQLTRRTPGKDHLLSR